MKKWKIAKIKIENFKPFKEAYFDLKSSALITLDGPNGFGKTSIFDAVELLFTGKIQRVIARNNNIIAKGKKKTHFEENLYWNKQKQGNLVIRTKLISEDGNDSLYLARVALISDLSYEKNNAPDNFSIFKLYQLESFDSDNFNNLVSDSLIEDFLGINFLKNFSLLNYLEQGENRYLHSTNANERKKGIEHLINTDKLSEQIQFFKSLESQINEDYVGKKHTDRLGELKITLNDLSTQLADSSDSSLYKRLSNSTKIPKWDTQDPITTSDQAAFDKLIIDVDNVAKILANRDELIIRHRNNKIVDLLNKKEDIKIALTVGFFVDKYEDYDVVNKTLNQVNKNIAICETAPDKILKRELEQLSEDFKSEELEELIGERDKKKLLSNSETQKRLQLLQAQKDLLKQFHENCSVDELNCPFCNIPWESKRTLEKAAQKVIDGVIENIDVFAKEIEEINASIKLCLDAIKIKLNTKKKLLLFDFNIALYEQLKRVSVKFDSIRSIIKELAEYQLFPHSTFESSEAIQSSFLQKAIDTLEQAKQPESDVIPPNWASIISSTFINESDIDKLSLEDFENKKSYLSDQLNQFKHDELQQTKLEIEKLEKKIAAGKKLKKKIVTSRKTIEATVELYTKRMIGDIGLLFHIYSGRLIQNYQRGLGLFLASGDGKVLKFSTVEHSEHDAILSMSSGQIAALGMAFFLTLNKVYASNLFVLIDDPVQSMDEINVASLCDLFRVEFNDRQILISNHEESISNFIRYKYKRAGLTQLPVNMLEINKMKSKNQRLE